MKPKTWTHPKFTALQLQLGLGPAFCAGILQALWHLASTFDEDHGKLPYSAGHLESWLRTGLDPDKLIGDLVEVGWLDDREDGLYVHDWADHRPAYINDRLRKRRKSPEVPGGSRRFQEVPESSPPSSSPSVSSSPSKKKEKKAPPPSFPAELQTEEFRVTWTLWEEHREEIRKPLTPKAIDQTLKKCAKWGQDRAIAAIEHTVANGWQGIREPEAENSGGNGQSKADKNAAFFKELGI